MRREFELREMVKHQDHGDDVFMVTAVYHGFPPAATCYDIMAPWGAAIKRVPSYFLIPGSKGMTLKKKDRAILEQVESLGGAATFRYAPDGKYARLVYSTAGLSDGDRHRLHKLTKRGLLTEAVSGKICPTPSHTWGFLLTEDGKAAIKTS